MKQVQCEGTPYELGFQHGQGAAEQVAGSLNFYKAHFEKVAQLQWDEVIKVVDDFLPFLQAECSEMLEEMKGLAEGAKVSYRDIIALNIRTEIAFGLFKPEKETDGCTALAYSPKNPNGSISALLGQNWDWKMAQQPNLILISLKPSDGKPRIKMVTEAGIIGKIGFNEFGVGVCLNAIRAQGVSTDKLPIHLALRTALQCKSASEAIAKLKKAGCASAGHILVAGPDTAEGLEFSSIDCKGLLPDDKGFIAHSNHYLLDHPGVHEPAWLIDSPLRVKRVGELTDSIDPSKGYSEFVEKVFKDCQGAPCAICRTDQSEGGSITIFSIAMDLTDKKGIVYVGNPVSATETLDIEF